MPVEESSVTNVGPAIVTVYSSGTALIEPTRMADRGKKVEVYVYESGGVRVISKTFDGNSVTTNVEYEIQ